jgi:hypothetical protein
LFCNFTEDDSALWIFAKVSSQEERASTATEYTALTYTECTARLCSALLFSGASFRLFLPRTHDPIEMFRQENVRKNMSVMRTRDSPAERIGFMFFRRLNFLHLFFLKENF